MAVEGFPRLANTPDTPDEKALHRMQQEFRKRIAQDLEPGTIHPANVAGNHGPLSETQAAEAIQNLIDIQNNDPRQIEAQRIRKQKIKDRKPSYWHQ